MENIGYEVQPFIIPACAKNAPHRRDRVWIIANRNGNGIDGRGLHNNIKTKRERDILPSKPQDRDEIRGESTTDNSKDARITSHTDGKGLERRSGTRLCPEHNRGESEQWKQNWYEVASELCGVDDGLPQKLDRVNRIKSLGNAIVPQIAETIFNAILEVMKEDSDTEKHK
jgi:DNA (cytosine-5)-methyltransferase 1